MSVVVGRPFVKVSRDTLLLLLLAAAVVVVVVEQSGLTVCGSMQT
jgi:hypothetical protein